MRRLALTAAAFASACALGVVAIPGPRLSGLPHLAILLGMDRAAATTLAVALLTGSMAWLMATQTVAMPRAPAAAAAAALFAALLPPLILPGTGVAVLLPALLLAIARWRKGYRTIVALIAVAGIAQLAPGLWGAIAGIISMVLALLRASGSASGLQAANDNPLLKRTQFKPSLYLPESDVTFGPFRIRGVGDHVHVQ